jgi:hypothetical protein
VHLIGEGGTAPRIPKRKAPHERGSRQGIGGVGGLVRLRPVHRTNTRYPVTFLSVLMLTGFAALLSVTPECHHLSSLGGRRCLQPTYPRSLEGTAPARWLWRHWRVWLAARKSNLSQPALQVDAHKLMKKSGSCSVSLLFIQFGLSALRGSDNSRPMILWRSLAEGRAILRMRDHGKLPS